VSILKGHDAYGESYMFAKLLTLMGGAAILTWPPTLFERTRRRKIAKQFSDGAGVSL
jgi:hypothetical protein